MRLLGAAALIVVVAVSVVAYKRDRLESSCERMHQTGSTFIVDKFWFSVEDDGSIYFYIDNIFGDCTVLVPDSVWG